MQQKILEALHAGALGGHSGISVTYIRISRLFAWPNLRKDVQQFVESCSICKQAKSEHTKYPGLLQPLEVPDQAWQVVTLDFVEGLPCSGGYNCILVVVDKMTRYAHFLPLAHPFTSFQVAKVYLDNVFKLHGMPVALVSDRDKVFTTQLWRELFGLSHTQLRMSSAYHPQTDGQTERVNQCMETYLRCFVATCPTKWIQWLTLAEFWYNTSYHSALGKTPFEALYNHAPRYFGIQDSSVCAVGDLAEWAKERELMTALLQQHLHRGRQRMKMQADKRPTDRTFAPGDWVYLKAQPYVQKSLATRTCQKLAFRFFGPYQIEHRVGAVAYKLILPEHVKLHPVVHVSVLKAGLPPNQVTHSVSPPLTADVDQYQVPERILQSRVLQRGSKTVAQVKIHWSGLPASLATWEDAVRLHSSYPRASIWEPEQVLQRRVVAKGASHYSQARIKWIGLPVAHATWEDEEKLRLRFPEAPAWGQAGTEGAGDVTEPDMGPPSAQGPGGHQKHASPVQPTQPSLHLDRLDGVSLTICSSALVL
jgi:transposase InsO family protein